MANKIDWLCVDLRTDYQKSGIEDEKCPRCDNFLSWKRNKKGQKFMTCSSCKYISPFNFINYA